MNVFIGAGTISSPLGLTLQENWDSLLAYRSGVQKHLTQLGTKEACLSKFSTEAPLLERCSKAIEMSLSACHSFPLNESMLIFSSTKGNIQALEKNNPEATMMDDLCEQLAQKYMIPKAISVSNACVSGISALIMAHDFIRMGNYKHIIVVAGDSCSDFVVEGFKTFFALSSTLCKPFDKNRDGINLGEAVGCAVLSSERSIYKTESVRLMGGASANDANHISGPSRTGEGLYRAISNVLKQTKLHPEQIDRICAHGTATIFNDEMESIAFFRAGLAKVPINSLKGYFGHTLGAAGLIETLISCKELEENILIGTLGFEEKGTSKELVISAQHQKKEIKRLLKTGSGFGGLNAAIVLEK